jgi:hypothetical protein
VDGSDLGLALQNILTEELQDRFSIHHPLQGILSILPRVSQYSIRSPQPGILGRVSPTMISTPTLQCVEKPRESVAWLHFIAMNHGSKYILNQGLMHQPHDIRMSMVICTREHDSPQLITVDPAAGNLFRLKEE